MVYFKANLNTWMSQHASGSGGRIDVSAAVRRTDGSRVDHGGTTKTSRIKSTTCARRCRKGVAGAGRGARVAVWGRAAATSGPSQLLQPRLRTISDCFTLHFISFYKQIHFISYSFLKLHVVPVHVIIPFWCRNLFFSVATVMKVSVIVIIWDIQLGIVTFSCRF